MDWIARETDGTVEVVDRNIKATDKIANLTDRNTLSQKKSPVMAIFFIGIEKDVKRNW